MAFSRGFNPGGSSVTEIADSKQADRELEIAAHGRAAASVRPSMSRAVVARLR